MTVALLAVTVLAVLLAGALVRAVSWARAATAAGNEAALRALEAGRLADVAVTERDTAVVNGMARDTAYRNERAAHVETARQLTAALEELHAFKSKELAGASPDDVAGVVAGMLRDRRRRQVAVATTAAPGSGDIVGDPPDV